MVGIITLKGWGAAAAEIPWVLGEAFHAKGRQIYVRLHNDESPAVWTASHWLWCTLSPARLTCFMWLSLTMCADRTYHTTSQKWRRKGENRRMKSGRSLLYRDLVDVHSNMRILLISRVYIDVSGFPLCVLTYHCFCGVESTTPRTKCRSHSDYGAWK